MRFDRLTLSLLMIGAVVTAAPEDFQRVLSFECEHAGTEPRGWNVNPRNGARVDGRQVHGGKWSVLIERDKRSARQFTALGMSVPVDAGATRVQLRGYLRTEVVRQYAGLWLRQDGERGMLALDNMSKRQLRGTTDWAQYRIDMVLKPGVRRLTFGALLVGEGKAWVDDLELRIDGELMQAAPKAERRDAPEFVHGSKVAVAALTPVQIRNLTVLGKVWGFLKYHHPGVTGGKWNWDHELFRVLPRMLAAKDAAGGNTTLLAWCRQIGAAPKRTPNKRGGREVHLRLTLDWIRDEGVLGKELCAWLGVVYENRHGLGEQHYVSLMPGVGNPKFKNEAAYARIAFPDSGYRALALFRFWNIIEYWFPYRDVIGEDWDDVLAEFLPRLVGARDADAYKLELMALIARAHDTHANLWSSLDVRPPRGKASLPVNVRFVEGKAVVVGAVGGKGGLEIGDLILAIDGRPVDALVREWSPFYAASNQPTRLRDIARSLTRGDAGPCRVRIQRDGKAEDRIYERVVPGANSGHARLFHDRPGATFQKLSPDVGYLKLSSVKQDEVDKYVRLARGTKGLVIDIRNYPSAFMVFSLGSRLVREPTPFARFTTGDLANPGTFRWGRPVVLSPRKPGYEGRVVILIDESSQSQAEYTTMAFRVAPDAIVVGSTTAGADGNISPIPLPGGLRALISGIGVFYPDKTPTQRIGIIPDVKVRPTLGRIRAGRDELLEAAIRQILGTDASDAEIIRMAKRGN